MKAMHTTTNLILGRGVVFHLPPSNVPLNSAYSLICGLLSGNANVVRFSSTESQELDTLVGHLRETLGDTKHAHMAGRICLLRYEHDDEVTSYFSALADARVIWGGDHTVSHIRSIPAKPRTVDVAFADRVSVALLKADAVESLDDESLLQLATSFYVDSYTFGQNACSSPRLVIWHGPNRDERQSRERFWRAVERVAGERNSIEDINFVNRLVELCEKLAVSDVVSGLEGIGSPAVRLVLADASRWEETSDLRFGTFSETMIESLHSLGELLDHKTQTISHFGYQPDEIRSTISDIGLKGVDRIVPMGQALNFDLVWDGYDLIGFLSRNVVVR